MIVNRGPAKGCVWPVLAPAEGIVRAGGCSAGGMRFVRGGLRSFYAGRALLGCLVLVRARHTFLPKCFMLDHACCLPHERQTGRLAICSVPIPPWVVIAIRAFSNRRCGYPAFLVHFGFVRFFMAIPTGNEETRERGERSRRRGVSALLRDRIGFVMFSAGSPLGAARPKPAPKSHWLSGLSSFDSRRGCVSRGEGHSGITKT